MAAQVSTAIVRVAAIVGILGLDRAIARRSMASFAREKVLENVLNPDPKSKPAVARKGEKGVCEVQKGRQAARGHCLVENILGCEEQQVGDVLDKGHKKEHGISPGRLAHIRVGHCDELGVHRVAKQAKPKKTQKNKQTNKKKRSSK